MTLPKGAIDPGKSISTTALFGETMHEIAASIAEGGFRPLQLTLRLVGMNVHFRISVERMDVLDGKSGNLITKMIPTRSRGPRQKVRPK
jgi:hypothetical protein